MELKESVESVNRGSEELNNDGQALKRTEEGIVEGWESREAFVTLIEMDRGKRTGEQGVE